MTIKTLKLFLEQFSDDLEVGIELDGKFDELTKVELQDVSFSSESCEFEGFNTDMVILS